MNDLALRPPSESTGFEMKPRNFDEALRFCDMMAKSDLVPDCYKGKPGNIMVAIQKGLELGLTPMRALSCIAVINGRAAMWGDDLLAMVLASPVCEYVRETDSNDQQGVCRVKRKDDPEEHVSTFSLAQAKKAGLLGKAGSWQTYTDRMLKLRARGFALRDKFADVLAGLITTEEAMDLPKDTPEQTPETEQPQTLKEKLKAKLADIPAEDEPQQEDGADGVHGRTPFPQQASDAPALIDQEVSEHCAHISTAHTPKQARERLELVPEALRQECWSTYTDTLKKLGKK